MMPRPARIFLAAAGALWLAAIVYGYVTGGDRLGPITLGWWGGIGEATGFVVLLAAALGAAALAATFLVGRASLDAPDPSDGVASAPSFAPSLAPLLAAAGLASVTVGLALGWPFVALGLAAIAGSASRWSEPARSDLGVATPRSIEEAPADRGPVPAPHRCRRPGTPAVVGGGRHPGVRAARVHRRAGVGPRVVVRHRGGAGSGLRRLRARCVSGGSRYCVTDVTHVPASGGNRTGRSDD